MPASQPQANRSARAAENGAQQTASTTGQAQAGRPDSQQLGDTLTNLQNSGDQAVRDYLTNNTTRWIDDPSRSGGGDANTFNFADKPEGMSYEGFIQQSVQARAGAVESPSENTTGQSRANQVSPPTVEGQGDTSAGANASTVQRGSRAVEAEQSDAVQSTGSTPSPATTVNIPASQSPQKSNEAMSAPSFEAPKAEKMAPVAEPTETSPVSSSTKSTVASDGATAAAQQPAVGSTIKGDTPDVASAQKAPRQQVAEEKVAPEAKVEAEFEPASAPAPAPAPAPVQDNSAVGAADETSQDADDDESFAGINPR